MGKFFTNILDHHKAFIEKQKMFFVASAPLSADGRVNLSPKGMDSFRIFEDNRVAYMDIIGSGNETSAHILENGRITFMFCAFDGPPLILRLYGKGYAVLPGDADFPSASRSGMAELLMSRADLLMAEFALPLPRPHEPNHAAWRQT